jgi:hypothetical protein
MYFFLPIGAFIKRIASVCIGKKPLSSWPFLIVLSCLTWTLIQTIAYPALDRHHDMLENFVWSQIAVWGTHKHPPFFAWVVGAWFNWVPNQSVYYKILAYANVAFSLWGVARLAQSLNLSQLAKPSVILLLWSFPYTTLASKFNANSQLLSLWPWTAVFMLRAWQAWGWRKLLYAFLLGIWAAACFLSKYFSGVFLLGLFIASVLHPVGRAWLKTPWPYLSLLVFGLAMWPHVQWVMAHDMVTLQYVEEQGNGHIYKQGLWGFALSPLMYWLPAWLVTVFVGGHAIHKTQAQGSWLGAVSRWAWQSWMPRGWSDTVFWLALIPWLISLVFGITSFVNLSTAWVIPIGYAFPLLWLRNFDDRNLLSAPGVDQPTPSPWSKLDRWVVPGLLGMLAFSLVLAWNNAWHSNVNYYRPADATATAILKDWTQRHPDSRLTWVGGDWAESGLLSFYGDPTLIVIPDLPGTAAASIYDTPDLTPQPGLIFCSLGPVVHRRPDTPAGACEVQARQWLEKHRMPVQPIFFQVSREGWRFPKPVAFEYVVFHTVP